MIDALATIFVVVVFLVVPTAAVVAVASLCALAWSRLRSTMTFPVTDNRIIYWPIVLAVIWSLLYALLWALYAVFWLPIISEIFLVIFGGALVAMWVGAVITTCRLIIQWAAARYWRTILSSLILPMALVVALLSSPFLWKESGAVADYVMFFANYHSYLAAVEKHPATEPRFVVWMSGRYDNFGVLYDETDQIASDHPSEAWTKKAEKEGVGRSYHRHIIGHFYFVQLSHL